MRRETTGRIVYRTTFVRNPAYRRLPRGLYSDELQEVILRVNVPEWRTVIFDGTRSRSEETTVDYGVRSLAFELRSVDRNTITYCKQLRFVRFCVERPIVLPVGGPPPHFAPTGETATIAGLPCRKAEYIGGERMHVWYSEEIDVDDPTGAVLRLGGVPGFVLQTEEIAESDRIDAVRRVTVAEWSFAPPPDVFAQPAEYRTVGDIDAARAEDRRLLDAQAGDAAPREKFVGTWWYETSSDTIRVDITPELRFRTTFVTAPPGLPGRTTEAQASWKGGVLVVEEPPNDRYFELRDGGRVLAEIGDELFAYRRERSSTASA